MESTLTPELAEHLEAARARAVAAASADELRHAIQGADSIDEFGIEDIHVGADAGSSAAQPTAP